MAHPSLRLFYGDMLRIVGNKEDIEDVEKLIGNSEKKLLEPDFISLFGGLLVGIIIGSIPIVIPSLPVPNKTGFCSWPIDRNIIDFKIRWFRNNSFLHQQWRYLLYERTWNSIVFTAVGIKAGAHFYDNFIENSGWLWLLYGSFITFIPIILLVFIGYKVLKSTICS